MNKQEFNTQLQEKLSGLPKAEIEERLTFYDEIIDDQIEDGVSEENAVSGIGSVDEIASQIISDIPITRLVKEKIKPGRKLRGWEIALLILGSPIWIPLIAAAFVVVVSIYVVLWSLIVSLWAVEAALAVSSVGCIAGCVIFAVSGSGPAGIAVLGAGCICAGLSVFLFFGCKETTKGVLILTSKTALVLRQHRSKTA